VRLLLASGNLVLIPDGLLIYLPIVRARSSIQERSKGGH